MLNNLSLLNLQNLLLWAVVQVKQVWCMHLYVYQIDHTATSLLICRKHYIDVCVL